MIEKKKEIYKYLQTGNSLVELPQLGDRLPKTANDEKKTPETTETYTWNW